MDARRFEKIVLLFAFVSVFARAEQPLSDTIRIASFPTHGRLIFRVEEEVPIDWKRIDGGFEIVFKGLGFTDLGAPLGGEAAWAAQFERQLRDPRLESLGLSEIPGGLKVTGRWKFPSGPEAPADPQMETFDYRDHSPGQFIVDFWVRKGPSVAETESARKTADRARKLKEERAEAQRRMERRIAAEKANSGAEELGKFCASPVSEENDVFLTFLPVKEDIDFAKYLHRLTADADFQYVEPKDSARDAQYVRLALKLYHQGDLALTVRTLDFMDAEEPNSSYREEMRFLRANALLKLGMRQEAVRIFNDLKTEARGRPVALYSALYLAGELIEPPAETPAPPVSKKKLERGQQEERQQVATADPLTLYSTFFWLATYYPENKLAWLFHMGAAEALAQIQQTEQAAKEYTWVAENAPTTELKSLGALRLGNLYLDRRQYPQALEAYSRGIRYFKAQAERYPPIHLNRGETLYGLGEREEARRVFAEYFDKYAGYREGWRATLRLGEIYGRLPGEKNRAASRDWYYQTINRYPLSPGATLARLRLLPCGDHGGFNFESAARFFDGEARSFDVPDQVSMVRYSDLRALAQARSFAMLGHEDAAADVARVEMGRARAPQAKAELAGLFELLFRRNIKAMLARGEGYRALDFFESRSPYLSAARASARAGPGASAGKGPEPDYLVRLSLTASKLGLGQLADRLAEEYRKEQPEGGADRTLASQTDLDERLRRSEKSFAEARALWMSGYSKLGGQDGAKAADEIRTKLDQVVAESPYSFQKELILGLLEESRGGLKTARAHALKAQVLMPASDDSKIARDAGTQLQIEGWLAELEFRAGEPKSALGMYRDLEDRLRDRAKAQKDRQLADARLAEASILGIPPVPTMEQVLIAQGRILEAQKLWGETAEAYSRAVDLGLGGNQAMYGFARALLQTGERKSRDRAKALLQKTAESGTDDFWKKLAQETLADLQLRDRS